MFQPESNRLGTEVALETQLLGGFDDNLKTVPRQIFLEGQRGYTGLAATRVRVRILRRNVDVKRYGPRHS